MTGRGAVGRIFIAPEAEAEMREQEQVDAVAGGGLRGDRYFLEGASGTFTNSDETGERQRGNDLTLIEQEAIDAIERESNISLDSGEHRRNLETRDVALNHLVETRFRIGDVVCEGDILCEPCRHLEGLTEDGVLSALTHRGGLRADIVEGGVIRSGDAIEPLE